MIRLSQLTALHVLPQDVARDLDVSPKLYAYQSTISGRTNTLLLQEDTSPLEQMTRSKQFAPFWSNVLLGTANSYPEQGLEIDDFHIDAELHEKMNLVTLPTIEYKRAILYFSQGFVGSGDIVGHTIRLFCKLSNGTEVTLCAVADFVNDSAITAQTAKLYESQIWNEGILIEYPDVEYLINADVPEVNAVRQFLFGQEKPTTIFIEQSSFTQAAVDDFDENGFNFTKLSLNVINSQSMPVTVTDDELYAQLSIVRDGFAIGSALAHKRWDVELYLNKLKNDEETYLISHIFSVNSYNSDDDLIESISHTITDGANIWNDIQWRPILDTLTAYAEVTVSIRIENQQTGLIIRKSATIVITEIDIQNFKAEPTIGISGLTIDNISNSVVRQVNQIVQSPEIPKLVQIERKIYIQSNQLNTLNLYSSKFTTTITVDIDVSGNSRMFLQIGDRLIQNNTAVGLLTFDIDPVNYNTTATSYLLLDGTGTIVASGNLNKIS